MAYKHGIYVSETPTSIVPAVNTTAGLPVVYGTAPLHLASDPAKVNKPVLCYSYAEAVAAFGYSKDWKSYTLCETIYTMFALYNRAPVVFVNVLDPSKHKKDVEGSNIAIEKMTGVIADSVLLDTLALKNGDVELVKGTDYEAAYNDEGNVTITLLSGGSAASATTVQASYTALDPSAVTSDDIIGGVDSETGELKGLETLNSVFPTTRLVPGIVMAPGWGHIPAVEAIMKAKAGNINEHFKAIVLVDVPTGEVKKYSAVAEWKNTHNYTGADEVVCWPMVQQGGTVYHMSTHILGIIATLDSDDMNGVPYQSPSNRSMQIEGTCLEDGTEILLPLENANYLNSQGIVTAINFIGGWKSWGNNTGAYPSNTDPKDRFICVRRMFNWHASTFIQTYWSKVDNAINKRLIQTIVDSENIRLNGLTARGVILGGRVEFLEDENPTTSLLDGVITFHTYMTPPLPAREIENTIEYDPDYFQTLFS